MKGGFNAIAGICGVIWPIIYLVFLLTAVSVSPSFSWADNWLSDLGGTVGEGRPIADTPTTAAIYGAGDVISGIIALVFAFGIWKSLSSPVGP